MSTTAQETGPLQAGDRVRCPVPSESRRVGTVVGIEQVASYGQGPRTFATVEIDGTALIVDASEVEQL